MFDSFKKILRFFDEPREERQIKREIELSGMTTNEKIVEVCKCPHLDTRKVEKAIEYSEESLKKLRENMYDLDGKAIVYRGEPPYRIKE